LEALARSPHSGSPPFWSEDLCAAKVESAQDSPFVLLSFVPLPTSRFALIQSDNRVLPKEDKQAQRYRRALRGRRAATVELEMREVAIAVLREGLVGQILECQ
jgi:hypothetical protein